MPTFPNSPPDIFLKTQRDLTYVYIIFKTEGSKESNLWEDFCFALSANYLLQRHTAHVCFPYINIGHHTSSNTDLLEILL